MCFIVFMDSVDQELRQGTAGMACLYSMKAGTQLEDPGGWRCLEVEVGLGEGWEG